MYMITELLLIFLGKGFPIFFVKRTCDDPVYEDRAIWQLKTSNPEEGIPFFMDRWQQYREGILSDASLKELMRSNQEYLLSTGAALREADRWPKSGMTMNLDEILSFQKKRMHWLDTYFPKEWADMLTD